MKETLEANIILLDIEGTTTPIDFVYQKLFPYVRIHLMEFLKSCFYDPEVQKEIQILKKESEADPFSSSSSQNSSLYLKENGIQWIYDLIVNLMDQDKKYTGLKSIQGKILKSGFERGILKGEVYPDVLPAFKRWTHQGKKIAIYSSGSIHTQQLLFENSTAGNLTGYISCYFDTTTGSKKERESYDKISKKLFVQPLQIVFLSDSLSELDAAKQAGLLTRWSVRSNEPLNQSKKLNTGHSVIFTFDEVYP